MNIIDYVASNTNLQQWLTQITDTAKLLVVGINGSLKTLALEAFLRQRKQPLMIYTATDYQAQRLYDEWSTISDYPIYLYPVNDVFSAEMAVSSPESLAARIQALEFLQTKEVGAVITTVAGMTRPLPAKTQWQAQHLSITVGKDIAFDQLSAQLVDMGYRRQAQVESWGDFSIRGSIVDIYPLTQDHPIRIDFFDTEVDTIRTFDENTQRSLQTIDTVIIPPATDQPITAHTREKAAERLAHDIDKYQGTKQEVVDTMKDVYACWSKGEAYPNERYYLSYLYPHYYSVTDYAIDTYTIIDDISHLQDSERQLDQDIASWQVQKQEEQVLWHPIAMKLDLKHVLQSIEGMTYFSVLQKGMGRRHLDAIIPIQYQTMQQFYGQLPLLKTELDRFSRQKDTVLFTVSSKEKQAHLLEALEQIDIQPTVTDSAHILPQKMQVMIYPLQTGMTLTDDHLVIMTEKELFESMAKKRRHKRSQHMSNAARIKSYNDLEPGDYVVHINHGIGQYLGMQTMEVNGVHQDYMTIAYKNDDQLFIPVTQLNLIQKYVAKEGVVPKLNRLDGKEWHKTKAKAAKQVEDIADELLALYAQRESEKGFAFSPDSDIQHAFEDAFPYVETEDQLRSVAEIKRDMERERPMDRLLVGDVGFGKTEVALRAVCKAVCDHKQVAFLAPTTILAQQHFETMKKRFADFAVNIGILNRFSTKKEQQETIQKLQSGQLDVVVGTHRLLSKDVNFADLGLLIIDEEQRFGVKHKERLKQLKHQVDVLTLTATPIPRTLHMSMVGVRDLSVIETPPADRYPVQTYVMERNLGAIKEAVDRELARGGQVFYLYNRVEHIEEKVSELEQLMPEARIAYAHGQMTEAQLEGILIAFLEGDYDVLVTTTIIETGVDMPNVNTLFVEDADHMGLSQLYQLRGRVGRSNRIAYAYFMYQPMKVLTESGEQKLEAIKEFTALGSGFKIAMRDLSIRGAGDLLGAQQHGFINTVGFDLYTQMLEEAIMQKRGDTVQQSIDTTIQLDVDAYLPTDYIQEERLKIEMYKRIREIDQVSILDDLDEELVDRFGEYPDEVGYLLMVAKLKLFAQQANIEKISQQGIRVTVDISTEASKQYKPEQYMTALQTIRLKATFNVTETHMQIVFNVNHVSQTALLQALIQFSDALGKGILQR